MVITNLVILVIIIIIIAMVFDFTNGFHDSANSIATIVSTQVLQPRQAVLFAAFFNFIAAFTFGVAVASTISKIIHLAYIEEFYGKEIIPYIVLSGLIGAIAWNLITWWLGLPTSSSHALIGGIGGAGIAAAGIAAIKISTIEIVVIFMVLSPLIGLVIGFCVMVAVLNAVKKKNPAKINKWFRKLQLVSSALYSFSHGTNDAQKTMGIITPLLFSIGYYSADVAPNKLPVPWWVIFMAYAAIALGTMAGGWRIVKTMGQKITKLSPAYGFAAETAGATTIIGASLAGIPVSTTHVITSCIMGVGATKHGRAVKWGVARRIAGAWILTIPASAFIGFLTFRIILLFI